MSICVYITGTSDRTDAVRVFHNESFQAYALNGGYFGQTSNPNINALTEFPPEYVNNLNKPKDKIPEILDDSDWDAWCNKYSNPQIINQEYDLIIDESSTSFIPFLVMI